MEIRSQNEYEIAMALYSEFGDSYWLGASDIMEEGTWLWDSIQDEVVTEFWGSGRPTQQTDLNCLIFGTSVRFYDYSCIRNSGVVCEYDETVQGF